MVGCFEQQKLVLSEARSWNSRSLQDTQPPEAIRGSLFPPLPGQSGSRSCWACDCVSPVSASVVLLFSLLLFYVSPTKALVIGCWTNRPPQDDLIPSPLITSAKTLSPNKVTLGMQTFFGEGVTTQPVAVNGQQTGLLFVHHVLSNMPSVRLHFSSP